MALPLILVGAAALTTLFGVKKGYDGYQDKTVANDIIESAKKDYEKNKSHFDKENDATNASLDTLGKLQLNIGQDFAEFRKLAATLLDKLQKNSNKDLKIDFPQHQLDKIDGLVLSTTQYLTKVVGGGVGGAAAAYAVYGGVMAFAAASTGTPIASLAGAAAYKATMAAIGGGSLATGGLGMAGGAMILGTVVAAPILAVAGWAFAAHAEEALSNAKKSRCEVDVSIDKMKKACTSFHKTRVYVDKIYNGTNRIYQIFLTYFDELKKAHLQLENGIDISQSSDEIIMIIGNGYQVAAILTDIITTPLFKPKLNNQGQVIMNKDNVVEMETDSHGMKVVNEDAIDETLVVVHNKATKFSIK